MNNDQGRVGVLMDNFNYDAYKLFDERKNIDFTEEALKGIHMNNPLASIFFSKENINALQEAIRYQVYNKSCEKYIISRQSDTELKLIMRGFYLQEAMHRGYDVMGEVRSLNTLILNFAVPKVLKEVQMYSKYKADVNTNPLPMIPRGELMSSKGMRVLEMKHM